MSNYIPLVEYANHMGINKGDNIFISSNVETLLFDALENGAELDLNDFIDGLIKAVGNDGTIIFPTYNWSFCKGKTFNYAKTPCKTGSLGTVALRRSDFRRTKHPIYSFAVFGKHQNDLVAMTNKDSFGIDSPFHFMHEKNFINYIIDVSFLHCFTFMHYVEQTSGVVFHRYIKNFTAEYVDEAGNSNLRTYSMFVRDLDKNVETIFELEDDFLSQNLETIIHINNSVIKRVRLSEVFPVVLNDILHNNSKKICRFIGQT